MKTKQWDFADKSSWPRGEWDFERDKKQWMDKATGYLCMIHRGPCGALCGYVGVPEDHPKYEDPEDSLDVEVHGGLTYASHCGEIREDGSGICHVVDGEDKVWWFGFDCAHYADFTPKYPGLLSQEATYKNWAYVERQVLSLARQLKEME